MRYATLVRIQPGPINLNENRQNYKATILRKIEKSKITKISKKRIKNIRNLEILNKFLKGETITKMRPAKLLIKKRGYLEILFQKSFIVQIFKIINKIIHLIGKNVKIF